MVCQLPFANCQLADEYSVSVKTLNRWLSEKKMDIPQGLICPSDLRLIYSTLGPPFLVKKVHK